MEAPESRRRELERIGAFSDAVIAVAITLLVLKIDVPAENQGGQLAHELLDLWPDLAAYALSFAVIGRFWFVHHRFFATLVGWDGRLVALVLGFLAFLVLIPFASDLVGRFDDKTAAPVTYAAILTATALMNWLIIRHAVRRSFVHPAHRAETARFGGMTALALAAVFALSIPVAFVRPHLAGVVWLLTVVVHPRWWMRHRA